MAGLMNLARMTSATIGTGTITLGSAVSGCLSFATAAAAAGIVSGESITYGIEDGSQSEVGRGVWTTPNTLTRVTVLASTNGGAKIDLSGAQEVFCLAAAEDFGMQLIETATGAGLTTISFTSIPQHYRGLLVRVSGRSTAGSTPGVNVNVRFNNDSGANYDGHLISVQNATVGSGGSAAAGTSIDPFLIPWSAAVASYVGGGELVINNYTDTSLFKHFLFRGNTIGAATIGTSWLFRTGGGQWRSATAINRVDLILSAGNWDTGSRASLWGVR